MKKDNMKDTILQLISMNDIINKYGLKHIRRKISCPFHGTDKHPSAQIYDNYFHCFTCGKHLDVIGFVEEYFNLDFQQAMQKINLDFNLGLDSKIKIDYKKIKEIEKKKKEDQILFDNLQKKFCKLCDLKFKYLKEIEGIESKVTINNWADLIEIKSKFEDKIELIEIKLDFLINQMYEFKKTRI